MTFPSKSHMLGSAENFSNDQKIVPTMKHTCFPIYLPTKSNTSLALLKKINNFFFLNSHV